MADTSAGTKHSGLRYRLRRLGAGADELDAEDLLTESEELGGDPDQGLLRGGAGHRRGHPAHGHAAPAGWSARARGGVVRRVGERPGRLARRRKIAGIVTGASVVVHGRLTSQSGVATIFNPSYELVA